MRQCCPFSAGAPFNSRRGYTQHPCRVGGHVLLGLDLQSLILVPRYNVYLCSSQLLLSIFTECQLLANKSLVWVHARPLCATPCASIVVCPCVALGHRLPPAARLLPSRVILCSTHPCCLALCPKSMLPAAMPQADAVVWVSGELARLAFSASAAGASVPPSTMFCVGFSTRHDPHTVIHSVGLGMPTLHSGGHLLI